jgi:hypothetical protein
MHAAGVVTLISFFTFIIFPFSGEKPSQENSLPPYGTKPPTTINHEASYYEGHTPQAYDPGDDCNDPGVGCMP